MPSKGIGSEGCRLETVLSEPMFPNGTIKRAAMNHAGGAARRTVARDQEARTLEAVCGRFCSTDCSSSPIF